MEDSQQNTTSNLPPKPEIRYPRVNFFETQKIISKLENILSQKIICYYTPEDITQGHPDIFIDHLKNIGIQKKLTLIVISKGGNSSASLRIASIIRDKIKTLRILIPSYCASAATVLALSADKILMSPSGYLSAIDTSSTHGLNPKDVNGYPVAVSVDQVKRIIKFLDKHETTTVDGKIEDSYRTLFKYIHPIVIGEIDRISSRTILIATMMMKMHPKSFKDENQINWIAQHLYNDYPEHGFPILYKEAKEIGLPVEKTDEITNDLLRRLVTLYENSSIEAKTHFSENYVHEEYYTNTIESLGMRSVYSGSLDRRLNSTTHRWQKENDLSRWVNIIAPSNPGEKALFVPLDYNRGIIKETKKTDNQESSSVDIKNEDTNTSITAK